MSIARQAPKGVVAGYWITTVLLALQMGFTAYAQLQLPQVAEEFRHLGFPPYFRKELAVAKLCGVVVLLLPRMPAWVKEWAYGGFAIVLVSAVVAHVMTGEGFAAWGWAVGTGVLWALSYGFWKRMRSYAAPKLSDSWWGVGEPIEHVREEE